MNVRQFLRSLGTLSLTESPIPPRVIRKKIHHAWIGSAPIKIPKGLSWSVHELAWRPRTLEKNTELWRYRQPVRTPPGQREINLTDDNHVTDAKDWQPIVPSTGLPQSLKGSRVLRIMGPKGATQLYMMPFICLSHIQEVDGEDKFELSVLNADDKVQRGMWGTTRSLLSNAVVGVMDGFTVPVRLVGVGYRASVESANGRTKIMLKLGYSHVIEELVPIGVEVAINQPTRILLRGVDKAVLGRLAANIRRHRPPEPYNGKGVFVGDETIKKKEIKKK